MSTRRDRWPAMVGDRPCLWPPVAAEGTDQEQAAARTHSAGDRGRDLGYGPPAQQSRQSVRGRSIRLLRMVLQQPGAQRAYYRGRGKGVGTVATSRSAP